MSKKKHYFMNGAGQKKEAPKVKEEPQAWPQPPIITKPGNLANWDGSKWTTLPSIRMEPLEDRLIVLPDPALEKTASGVIVPESYQDKHVPARGTIIAVGPGKEISGSSILFKIYLLLCNFFKIEPDLHSAMPLKPGQRVMYGRYAGVKIEDPDDEKQEFLIMRLADVFIKL